MKFLLYNSVALLISIVLSTNRQLPYDPLDRDMSAVHPGRMDGKVCLITGATSGLGKDAALHLVAEGCKVVFTGRREDKGKAVEALLKSKGGDALFVKADVTKPSDCKMMVDKTVEKYGRLDAAFNNAGIFGDMNIFHKFHEYPDELFSEVIDTNIKGVFYSMKHEIIQMLKNGGGSIINCGSILSNIALPGIGAPYTTSKHAQPGLTKTAALEYAVSNIRVNMVSPGWVPSEMTDYDPEMIPFIGRNHPQGRWGKPEEISSVVAWLMSTDSNFVNGENIEVSSGLSGSHIPPLIWKKEMADAYNTNIPEEPEETCDKTG